MNSIKREIKKIGLLSLYFFIGFSYILILMKLLLEQYSIDYVVISKAFIASLVAAKVVAIMEITPWFNYFSEYPRYIRVLYKTFLYNIGVIIITAIENIFHAYHETKAIIPAISLFLETRHFSHFLATVMFVSIVFLIHNILTEIDDYLGKGNLRKLFFNRR